MACSEPNRKPWPWWRGDGDGEEAGREGDEAKQLVAAPELAESALSPGTAASTHSSNNVVQLGNDNIQTSDVSQLPITFIFSENLQAVWWQVTGDYNLVRQQDMNSVGCCSKYCK